MIDRERLIIKIALHMPVTKKEFAYALLYFKDMEADLCKCILINEV